MIKAYTEYHYRYSDNVRSRLYLCVNFLPFSDWIIHSNNKYKGRGKFEFSKNSIGGGRRG